MAQPLQKGAFINQGSSRVYIHCPRGCHTSLGNSSSKQSQKSQVKLARASALSEAVVRKNRNVNTGLSLGLCVWTGDNTRFAKENFV